MERRSPEQKARNKRVVVGVGMGLGLGVGLGKVGEKAEMMYERRRRRRYCLFIVALT